MEIKRHVSPFEADKLLDCVEKIFGATERKIEEPQLNGSEAELNLDVVYTATEGDEILGSIHATVPKCDPAIAGLSAMFTMPEARGMGLGKKLFAKIVEEIDSLGVKTAFLGTGNPIAEKLYASFGFRYLMGTGVMIRMKEGGIPDFISHRYDRAEGKITVANMTPAARLSIIPLAASTLDYSIYDANVGLGNPSIVTLPYCMSLYFRFMSLKEKGGAVLCATDERGIIGAVATTMPDGTGNYCFDFYGFKSYVS